MGRLDSTQNFKVMPETENRVGDILELKTAIPRQCQNRYCGT